MRREIKSEVLYCIKQQIKDAKSKAKNVKQKMLKAYGINTKKISNT